MFMEREQTRDKSKDRFIIDWTVATHSRQIKQTSLDPLQYVGKDTIRVGPLE